MIKQIKEYIYKVFGEEIRPEPLPKTQLGSLPIYIGETYKLYSSTFFNQLIVLAEPKSAEDLSIQQIEKHFSLLKTTLERKVVLILTGITALNRKRLIEKGLNFIVPDKQLYLPELLIDLKENLVNSKAKRKNDTLLPSAQFLLIYHIIHRNDKWKVEEHSFKEIAKQTGYTAMTITKAVENLKYLELVDVIGEKEKFIHFRLNRNELWHDALTRNLLVSPVLKTVFVDEKPENFMLQCNVSALPEYTDMNPGRHMFYALDKNKFYELQKKHMLLNANEYEGRFCIEVWKYNPEILVGELPNDAPVVDPLSLYLSLKESKNERIEMALEQIISKIIW